MTLEEKIQEFIDYRKAIKKPIRTVSIDAFMRNLIKLGNGNEEDMIEILEQSIANSWQGIFALKNKPLNSAPTFQQQAIAKQESLDKLFKTLDNDTRQPV